MLSMIPTKIGRPGEPGSSPELARLRLRAGVESRVIAKGDVAVFRGMFYLCRELR